MDRVETFVGQEIYEWYFSKQAQHDMVGLAKLAGALLGTGGFANGLPCTQTTVASMQVSIGGGELYQSASLEATVCGTLPTNNTDQILKQGILLGSATPYNLPASSTFATPGTIGQSINYLIEAQYQDQDVSIDPTTGATPVVLNFYNSANPATPWSGPNNTGANSYTIRKGVIAWQVKAGTPAATGTQTTPAPDSGWIGLYVVTVAYGASTIINSNISTYPGAPILPTNGMLAGGFQNNFFNAASAGGTADALTASFFPTVTSLAIGVPSFLIRAASVNATTAPTFTPNSGVIAAKTIVKGNGLALVPGDIAGAGHWIELQYDATLDKWVLLNPATGVSLSNHGQCRLSKSGANLLLSPFNGNKLVINGAAQNVPSAGVTLAATSLTAGTLYYIYAYMNAGAMALEASATGHATDTNTGVEIKSGDATRTLVGMGRPIAGPAWQDATNQRFVIGWFNRKPIIVSATFSANRSTSSTTPVELNAEIQNQFLTWSDELAESNFNGVATLSGAAGQTALTNIGVDSTTVNSTVSAQYQRDTNSNIGTAQVNNLASLSEGYHYATVIGYVSASSASWATANLLTTKIKG